MPGCRSTSANLFGRSSAEGRERRSRRRAVLTAQGLHAGSHHDLNDMVSLLDDSHLMKAKLREIEHLAAFATSYRYPSPVGRIKAPSADEFARTAKLVETALLAAAKHLSVTL